MSVKKKVPEKVEVYRTQSYWDLFEAIGAGSEEKVIDILQNTSDPQALLRKRDLQGLTPLKKATALSKAEISRILVSYGADPSVCDPLGRTALHVAAMQGKRELIAPLLVSSDSSVNVQDHEGWTPLHLAVRGQHEKAINWLLYAGADINLKNKHDVTPRDMTDADSPLRQILDRQAYNLDDCPVELCSAFIGPKQLNMIGSGGIIMFVTSGLWSDFMQFFFNVRIRPYDASPPIPLRQDEMFFSDVCRYRMMHSLPPGLSRVHAYFLSFEYFRSSELILKITSKSKYLGEVPVALSTYTQDNFTCFLASAELDLKDAGQFVLVYRNTPVLLIKGNDGVYSNARYPAFKCDLSSGSLPGPPPNWELTRESRAREETEAMLRSLHMTNDPQQENQNKNADQSEAEITSEDAGFRAEGEDGEGNGGSSDEEGENTKAAARRLQILDGDEPDECEDFYYISKGYGLYLEFREKLPLQNILDKPSYERNIVNCSTGFYNVYHTSGQQPKYKCRIQIPKTFDFVKVGTVLVFIRDNLTPGEEEFPDPDDKADEHFLSEDGKNVWGTYWLNREKERWSLLNSGIANKRTRVIFDTNRLSTFILVQLKNGTQKWEPESEDEISSDEESEKERPQIVPEKDGVEEGEENERDRKESIASAPRHTESTESQSKAKKKNVLASEEIIDYGDDDISIEEFEAEPSDEESRTLQDHGSQKSLQVLPTHEETGSQNKEHEAPAVAIQQKASIAQEPDSSEHENKDENASNMYRQGLEEDRNENSSIDTRNQNNNASGRLESRHNRSRNNNQDDDEEPSDNLTPEERTVVMNLDPTTSNYALVVGIPNKIAKAVKTQSLVGPDEKAAEEVVEQQEEQEIEDEESDEDLPVIREKILSISQKIEGKTVLQPVKFGPPLTEINIHESDEIFLKNCIALMWRYRNHKQATAAVFSRPRDGGFDMVIEIVQRDDLYVRAEHWWSQDYKMISESSTFPLKSGRHFSFAMDGTMTVESPPGSSSGYILTRTTYCYLSKINSLQYFVRRGSFAKEDEKGPKKGPKKREDTKSEPSEPDAVLEITAYPRGTRTNGVDVALIPILLSGPDLWYDRHVELRKSDNVILARLVKFLRKESELVKRWWKVVIMLGYSEKMVEAEKGKLKSSVLLAKFLKQWFEDNLNTRDRGILSLITILNIMELESTIEGVLDILKNYKAHLITVRQKPRYLKLLFHWILQTKITRNTLVRMIGPQIMKPVSDIFLLRLSELLNPDKLYKIGASMDVEDNVIHAVAAEEVITDPEYMPFRVFIKSRQKKDEILHFTLLLLHMVKQCEQPEAKNFVVNETRKWMETVADTEPEICAKLHNVFD